MRNKSGRGGRRRRRLVDPIVGTPNRRKRPTVDPRRQRRKPLTPEQRKKIQESMEGGRRRFREVLKRAGVLRRPKTTRGTASARYRGRPKRVTRGTVTAPVRKQRRPR